tara:strand:- start:501 stop:830 length:330 start_codon:yes stop_codon:yes gene_type:complete
MSNEQLGKDLLRFLKMIHNLPFEHGIAPPIAMEIRKLCLGLEGLLESEMHKGLPLGDPWKSLSDDQIEECINSWIERGRRKKTYVPPQEKAVTDKSREDSLEEYYMTHR